MTRVVALVILALCGSMAACQDVGGAIRNVIGTLKDKELLPKPNQIPPTQPQVNDPTVRAGQLPEPSLDPSRQQLKVDAGNIKQDGPNILLNGNAHLVYQGYDIYADKIEGNSDTKVFKGTGNVRVYGEKAFVKGDEVTVNLRNETFLAKDSYVDARPELLGGNVLRDLYFKGGTTYGSQQEIFGEKCDITSCDRTVPHYHIEAAKVTVRPGRRAIFRKLSIKLFNKTILRLPYLSIPLDERTYRYLPEVGQTFDEGYYAKFKFGIPLKDDNTFLDTRVDYYTKKGPALGFDFNYANPVLRGIVSAYSVLGQDKTFTVNTRHRQEFKLGILTLDNNYQKNNYLSAPESSILNTRVGFLIPQGRGTNTRLDFLRNENDSANNKTQTQNFKVSDIRRWNEDLRTAFDVAWSKSENSNGSFSSEREQVDLKFRGNYDLQRATAQFDYQRAIPVGDTNNFFSGADRTPVVTLLTDSRKLFGRRNFAWPFNAEVSLGEFANSLDKNRVTRANFDININRPDRSNHRFRFDVNGRFKQGIYSDDTAQYNLGLAMQASYALGYDTSINLRYNYLRPYGFSPLQIDRIGRSNLITADLSSRPFRTLLIGAQTGYDILQLQQSSPGDRVAWQSVGVRMEYRPVDYISLRALSTYDSFQGAWNNLRVDLAYKPGATFVGLGAKYDGIRKTWSSLTGFVDGFKWGRLRTSALFSYNGYLQRFESRHFQFTYDLHCAEAILTIIDNPVGFRSGTSINFYVRIKAFPFNTGFGTGTSGQPVSLGGPAG
ncbi:MAG TPA: hypothetical protein VJ835_08980 [Fimbriimonadaceae bacterium]|nr:hypothetical protein [Fimbriimonadaceae bacterium]